MSLNILWTLQELDSQLDALEHELSRIQTALHEPVTLQELRQHLEALAQQRISLERQQRDLELEMQGLVEQRTQLERRLYGGYITSPREVEAAQQKAEELRHRENALEDHILEIMLQLEALQEETTGVQERLQEEATRWAEEERTLRAQQREAEQARSQLLARRAQLTVHIPPSVLTVYQRLRVTKKGIAVARLENRECQACGVEVPVNIERQVKYSQDLVFCPTCGRILVA